MSSHRKILADLAFKARWRARNTETVLIHAGLHKTGSTSVQNALTLAGVLQPSNRSDFRDELALRRVLQQARVKKRVVSSEHFFGEMLEMYSGAPNRLNLVKKLARRSEITVYLRPHPVWHVSAYSQIVQQGTELDPEAYALAVSARRYFSWNRFASDLLQISDPFAHVRIRSVSDTATDYARHLGLPQAAVTHRNLSLSPMALEALTRFRREGSIPPDVARTALIGFMPETTVLASPFSREFQALLVEMQEDWFDLSNTLAATGQGLSDGWQVAYTRPLLPTAGEIFSKADFDRAKKHVRDALTA